MDRMVLFYFDIRSRSMTDSQKLLRPAVETPVITPIYTFNNGSHSLIIVHGFPIYMHISTSHSNFRNNSQHACTLKKCVLILVVTLVNLEWSTFGLYITFTLWMRLLNAQRFFLIRKAKSKELSMCIFICIDNFSYIINNLTMQMSTFYTPCIYSIWL